jgi:hypothetical protein
MRIAVILFFLIAAIFVSEAGASVGKLTEVTGPTQIVRGKDRLEGKVGTEIEQDDTIETLKARVSIEFEDHTLMQITEFSKLRIDEFVYDPASGKGKVGMKTAFGTVRYASGLIAKNSREDIKVQTPTAKISVRGTDFSMTVSEDGKSLIILLPSRPEYSATPGVVGVIEVINAAGSVLMTQAYQATFIASMQSSPTNPVILNFHDESKINNLILVETPKPVTSAVKEAKKQTQANTSDSIDDKPDKKSGGKSDSPTAVSQVEPSSATQVKAEETPIEETKTAIIDVKAMQPELLQALAEVIAKNPEITVAKTDALPSLIVTATVNNGFTTDGVNAIMNLSTFKGTIQYKLKADTSATFKITDSNGTTVYPLNFGDKLKVNIIQK